MAQLVCYTELSIDLRFGCMNTSQAQTGLFRPRPSIIQRPGILSLPDDLERYVVPAGGSVVVGVEAGDTVTVVDIEGLQPCELVTAATNGRMDANILNQKPDKDASGLHAILAGGDESAERAHTALKRRNVDVAKGKAIRVFGTGSKPGDRAEFKVENDGFLIVCAPGKPMDAELQDTITPIELFIKRTKLRKPGEFPLPEPLADPVLDFRIHKATAESFTVKQGEYIQIKCFGRNTGNWIGKAKQSAGNGCIKRQLLALVQFAQ